ncbi:hypothetical protein ABFX02_05G121900 [Erythranthe guttata]
MGGQGWSLTAKPCDTCKAAAATVFCRADSAFLCAACDEDAHAADSRHARVWVCEVCEQAPAAVTCKADAAALCPTCDRDIHSANPLALRHERIPIVPFYDAADVSVKKSSTRAAAAAGECSDEEAEAASWLLPDPNSKPDDESGLPEYKSAGYLFNEMDPYLDLDLGSGQQKLMISRAMVNDDDQQKQYCSDGVVPVQKENEYGSGRYPGPAVDGFPTYDLDYPAAAAKPFMYNFTSQSITQTVSCSSMDVGVVPDDSTTVDISNTQKEELPVRLSGVDREARVMRYKEKRKNRKFEKTIRYASRKAYAETRPRVKGRFAKRETDASSYGVVPTY